MVSTGSKKIWDGHRWVPAASAANKEEDEEETEDESADVNDS